MALLKSTAIVSLMTLASRVLGFLRDVVIARTFGAGADTDAFIVALRIPNMMRRWFAEGSFSLAFVPVMGEYKENRDKDTLKELVDAVAGTLLAALLVVVAIGVLAAPGLVTVFAYGLREEPATFELASDMLRITFPYALFISLTAMAGGILNTLGRFAVPAITPIFLNIAMIAGAIWAAPYFERPIVALAWSVLVAGVIQLAFQVPSLARLGLLPRPRFDLAHRGVRKIGRLMLPTLFGSSVAQVNILIDNLIASLLVSGSITWLYYSDRLLEFPLGAFGIAISTVILPSLSRKWSGTDTNGFSSTLSWGLKMGFLISLPAAVGLAALATPIVATLFNYGEFSALDVRMTAASVIAFAFGLPAYVQIKILAPAYYSRQDTKTPVKIAVLAMMTNVVLNLLFVYLLQRFPVAPAHAGIAFASSISAYVNAGLLYYALGRSGIRVPAEGWMRHLVVIGLACVAMGLAVWYFAPPWVQWTQLPTGERIQQLLILVGGGAVLFGAITWFGGILKKDLKDAPL